MEQAPQQLERIQLKIQQLLKSYRSLQKLNHQLREEVSIAKTARTAK